MTKDLTIIIVTFNSSEVIENCLSRLNTTKYNVVVVDNASQDNVTQIVADKFPRVKLIKNEKNLGFGKANNIALRQADTAFALILNPDAYISEEDIEISLNILKNNSKIALASPKVFHIEAAKTVQANAEDYSIANFIIGGVLFMNLSILRKIGFFDENYFMFAEDNEISDRAIDNGYINVIINKASAFHIGGSSSKKSLRTTYRRFWHLGWSKSKYKQTRKGKLQAARATLRLSIIYFCESAFYLLIGNINKSVSKFAFASGCFSFLIGLKAFKKNGMPRG
ncbi:MAG: glycosyltransferase family 2 protein [Rickettsiaceae bacterium]|jgi:GT2 family glycosyltransferase|nr:glycosyltransferase family 2 protein [Rickettsiaceae bacterium]